MTGPLEGSVVRLVIKISDHKMVMTIATRLKAIKQERETSIAGLALYFVL